MLSNLKLTLQQYLLLTLSALSGILLIVIGYKNKQLHRMHVELIGSQFETALQQSQKVNSEASAKANDAYKAYLKAREKYVSTHGNF